MSEHDKNCLCEECCAHEDTWIVRAYFEHTGIYLTEYGTD